MVEPSINLENGHSDAGVLRFIAHESKAPVGRVTATKIEALIESALAEGVSESELHDLRKLLEDLRTGSISSLPEKIVIRDDGNNNYFG